MKNIAGKCYNAVSVLLLVLFAPVLFSLIVWGEKLDYYDNAILPTLRSNAVLFAAAVVVTGIYFVLFYLLRGWQMSRRSNLVLNVFLTAFFVGLYFLNEQIAKEIAYYTGQDADIVRACAYQYAAGEDLGYNLYLVIYPNNISISYIMGAMLKLIRKVTEKYSWYPYNGEFIWIQANCLFLSVSGLAACMTVKRQTRNITATLASLVLYVACIGLTPWKIIPYTDMYAIAFPILSVCFYVYYRKAERGPAKLFYLLLAYLSAGLGGIVKRNVYLVMVALLLTETLAFLHHWREKWKYLLVQLCVAAVLLIGAKQVNAHMIAEMGLEQNEQIAVTWHHYLFLGLNEDATGGYNGEDKSMIGEFQDQPISVRNEAELERAWGRIKDRGFWGTLHFWLKKMVMTFNDGTLSWGPEGGYEYAYQAIASNTARTEFLRDIFWKNRRYMGQYNTVCQAVWILMLLGIPGVCFCKKQDKSVLLIFPITFIGIFLYILLFEARARYLIAFAPFLVTMSVIGMSRYAEMAQEATGKNKEKSVQNRGEGAIDGGTT